MDENTNRTFILNNCLAAVSAVPLDNITIATDGFECITHSFDLGGNFIETNNVIRPYRRLRQNPCGGYTALSDCNARIYFLNENFAETDFSDLNISRRNSCNPSNSCNSCGFSASEEITDASAVTIGSEMFIVGAFRKNAYLFDLNGRRLTRLCETDQNEVLTDFLYMGNDLFAMSTLCGNTRTITVSDNGNIQSGILERCQTLRMLIPLSDGIYGLFGKGYILNRIIKIYSDGVLTLPRS